MGRKETVLMKANKKFATGGGVDDDGGGGMSVLKKVYPLGQVPQITTTQHRGSLPQQRQALERLQHPESSGRGVMID